MALATDLELAVAIAFADPQSSGTDQARALELLSQLPNPAAVRDEEDKTLLHWACRNKWKDVANALMEEHIRCQSLEPVILLAFKHPSFTGTDQARALELLSQLPNPAAVRDKKGRTLLHWACRNEWGDVVKLLIESNKMESEFLSILEKRLNSYSADQASVLQLLSWHPNPAAIRGEAGKNLLHHACRREWGDVAKMLLEMAQSDSALDPATVCLQFQYPSITGTDQARALELLSQLPNPAAVRDEEGETLLHWACRNRWGDVVKLLIESNKLESEFLSILLKWSSDDADQASIPELLSWHPNPAAIRDGDGKSLLNHACRKGWSEVAKMLLEMGQSDSALDPTTVCLQFQYPSITGTDQACALELLSQLPHPAAVKDEKGNTLLQWASKNGWYDVVKELVEKYHCDPNYKIGLLKALLGESEGTALLYACQGGHLDIVKYLVQQGGDPQRSHFNFTPLHAACDAGHLDVVKFLVTECRCNPLLPVTVLGITFGCTPLDLACDSNHSDVIAFLLSSGTVDRLLTCKTNNLIMRKTPIFKQDPLIPTWDERKDFFVHFFSCRRKSPFHPAFKVFVMGNPSAGKSTLVKAIQSRMTNTSLLGALTAKFKKVSGVKLQTAGIIPVPIASQELGDIIMYDLAGQYQYYSSHAALLEKLVSSPGALLVVVVDLSKSKEEITQQLQYWSSFIENHCSHSSSKPAVVVIGSHADVVKSQKENPAQKSADILKNPSSSLQTLDEIISLDCTQLGSGGLTKVCDVITRHMAQFQKTFNIDLQVHFLYDFLSREFKGQTACRISEIISHIAEDNNTEMTVGKYQKEVIVLLPRDTPTLSRHLTTLSEKGRFLYLRNDRTVEDSWVILDQEVLLSEVNGTVFAPENFKEHHDISSSTGVVPFSKIEQAFPSHSPEMIVSFLSHLEFCQQIAEAEASVISGGQLGGSQQSSETFYFFPALVSEDRPTESCQSIEQTHYKCGWSLQCIRSDQFLSPRFLHVLLLRLAFSFALAPETAEKDKACPVLQRRCNVWKAGIHWQNRDGVEAIVEVVEQNTAVTMVMGCLEGREVECAGLRSELIQAILATKERFCAAVELRESFIHPAELSSYPLKSSKLLPSFTITELAAAITEDKQVVTRKQGHGQQMLGISELLYFEPYTCFNSTLLAEMFKTENSDKEVPDIFHLDAGKAAHSKMHILVKILEHNPRELQAAIAIAAESKTYKDDPMHNCFLLFRTWALCSPSRTYQALRSALDRFSVFCGRNPLVSVLCILCMRPSGQCTLSLCTDFPFPLANGWPSPFSTEYHVSYCCGQQR